MNYYERIQQSIDQIERQLDMPIDIERIAQSAYMSMASFYRMFFSLTGYTIKAYIRMRRLNLAARDLKESNDTILALAVKYDFESADSFTRTFKKHVGIVPSVYRHSDKSFEFERINLMDKYFDIQDPALMEKYPEVKVLKSLEPMRVAYSQYIGKDPETHAFDIMQQWLSKRGLNINEHKLRIFGYNNPSPSSPDQEEYGYEVCVTLTDDIVIPPGEIGEKVLSGGLYAVSGVKRGESDDIGLEIMKSWQRLNLWLKDSKYTYGGHQWLEEHLGFDEEAQHIGGIDLYMPIELRKYDEDNTKSIDAVAPMTVAAYVCKGKNAMEEGRAFFTKWLDENGFFEDGATPKIFAYYNHERMGRNDFFYKIQVEVPESYVATHPDIVVETFKGGIYAVMPTQLKRCGFSWNAFLEWLDKNEAYTLGDYWFFETYEIKTPEITLETPMHLYLNVKPIS